MAFKTPLDDITTLRGVPTVVPKQTADQPARPAPSGPTVKAAGQGQVVAENPIKPMGTMPLPSPEEYAQAQLAGQAARGAQTGTQAPSGTRSSLVEEAKKWVGTPYVWGKSGPLGFDCSGFTQYVFRKFGVDLPRISNQQGFGGTGVNREQAQPGDLVFWDNSSRNNGADHVGIYLGNGQVISAPKPGDRVKIQALYGNPFFRRYL